MDESIIRLDEKIVGAGAAWVAKMRSFDYIKLSERMWDM